MDRRSVLVSLTGLAGASASVGLWQAGSIATRIAPPSTGAKAQPPIRQRGAGMFGGLSLAQVPLGGGGFVTGIDISADGQRFVCRTDVTNAYVREAGNSAWRPLFSPTTMLAADYDPLPEPNGKADGRGVAGIRIAPSDKDVIVASFLGYVWVSVDGGRSVRRTQLPQVAMPANSGVQRLFNRTIDIHPRDARRIVVGTHGEGLWFTADAGRTWAQARLPTPRKSNDDLAGIYLVQYDPVAADRIYAFVTGFGLYRSDNGPAGEFQPLTGGPTMCSSLVAARDGAIFLCEHTKDQRGKVWRYASEAGWASSKPEREAMVLAVNPREPSQLIAIEANGFAMESNDNGTSWESLGDSRWQENGGEVAWTGGLSLMFPAEIVFDPITSKRLWIAEGVGVARGTLTSGSYVQVEDWSAGIEEFCMVAAIAPPSGVPVVSALDKPFWRIENMASYSNNFRYPSITGKAHEPNAVSAASYLDFAGDDPRFLVGVAGPANETVTGYSADGGQTWKAFDGKPSTGWGYGGCIAASTSKNIVLLPSNNGIGVYTLDGGKNWSSIRLDGVNATGGFSNAHYVARKNLAADKTRPGTFATVYTVIQKDVQGNDAHGNPLGGVWLTRDGGRNWTQVLKGVVSVGSHDPKDVRARGLDERQFWQCQLDYVPGQPGELVYTPHADFEADRFYWSNDDGRSWSELHPDIRNVVSFGFGKAPTGSKRPAIYFWGSVAGKEGLYASLDWFKTAPKLLTRFPSQMLAQVSFVIGDPNALGRIYVGTKCGGVVRVEVETLMGSNLT